MERFAIDLQTDAGRQEVYTGTVIGYKRIAVLPAQAANALRIRILDARCAPTLSLWAYTLDTIAAAVEKK